MAEMTFYPDAGIASVDGAVREYQDPGETWANMVGGAGTHTFPDHAELDVVRMKGGGVEDRWVYLFRAIYLFDSSGLPDGCRVTGAVFSLYGTDKLDELSCTPNICVYASDPNSDTALIAADYTSLGTVELSNTITYAAWNTAGYNDFTLIDVDTDGFGYIKKGAGAAGITKLGVRNANYDVTGTKPNWVSTGTSKLIAYYTEQGIGFKPKLVVTYTVLAPSWTSKISGVTNPAKIMGVAVANIAKVKGVAWKEGKR